MRLAYAGKTGPVLSQKRLELPLHWKKPRRIGVQFMGDLFDEQIDEIDGGAFQREVIRMAYRCPQHTLFYLTKQPQNMAKAWDWSQYPMPNIYLGVSICDQEDADRMIPELLKVLGKHWVSVEPMLGPVDFTQIKTSNPFVISPVKPIQTTTDTNPLAGTICTDSGLEYDTGRRIDFLVLGSESGKNRRPCPHEWMIDVVEQCQRANIPVWVKQIQDEKGRVIHDINLFPEALKVRELRRAT